MASLPTLILILALLVASALAGSTPGGIRSIVALYGSSCASGGVLSITPGKPGFQLLGNFSELPIPRGAKLVSCKGPSFFLQEGKSFSVFLRLTTALSPVSSNLAVLSPSGFRWSSISTPKAVLAAELDPKKKNLFMITNSSTLDLVGIKMDSGVEQPIFVSVIPANYAFGPLTTMAAGLSPGLDRVMVYDSITGMPICYSPLHSNASKFDKMASNIFVDDGAGSAVLSFIAIINNEYHLYDLLNTISCVPVQRSRFPLGVSPSEFPRIAYARIEANRRQLVVVFRNSLGDHLFLYDLITLSNVGKWRNLPVPIIETRAIYD